jgi:hypothetical protein
LKEKSLYPILLLILVFILISIACTTTQSVPTGTPEPTATVTGPYCYARATTPSHPAQPGPRSAATEHAEMLDAEIQSYYEKGYLATPDGQLFELDDFSYDWAQLGWYNWLPVADSVSDFYMGAHFKWDSALRNSDTAGCGFIFGIQQPGSLRVFLDRTKVYFLITDRTVGFSAPITPTRGTGRVKLITLQRILR